MTPPSPPVTRTAPRTLSEGTGATGTTTRTRVEQTRRGWLVAALEGVVAAAAAVRTALAGAARWSAETVNPAGWLAVGMATLGLAAGWWFGWIEVLVAALGAVVLLLVAVPFLFGARGFRVELTLDRDRIVAGDRLHAEVVVHNGGAHTALPGRLDLPVGRGLVEVGVPLLRPGRTVVRPVEFPALRRGVVTVGPPVAVRSDPVGLLRREHRWDQRREIHVHPRTVAVPSVSAGLVRDLEGSASRRLVDADMSFHAIREYVPGDARRQIHWKSTAKTGRLMVRQFEESRRSRLAVVLDLDREGYAGDDEFELGVSVAASCAYQAARDGRELDVVTGTAAPRTMRSRSHSIELMSAVAPRTVLDGFSRLDALADAPVLPEVCRLAAEACDGLSLVFLVCGSQVSPLRLRQSALAFSAETAVVAVICDDGASPARRPLGDLVALRVGLLPDLTGLLLRGVQS